MRVGTVGLGKMGANMAQRLHRHGHETLGHDAGDSGEGRWTVQEAVDRAVPTPAVSAALYARFTSRQEDSTAAMRAIAALRDQFGGHAVKEADDE